MQLTGCKILSYRAALYIPHRWCIYFYVTEYAWALNRPGRHKTGSHFPWQCVYTCHINLTRKKRPYIVMIKLNDICIQYTAWCRRDTHTATSLTHTPWSTRLGPARSQHGENRMRLRIREIDPRNGIGGSDGEILSVLVKIKTVCTDRCVSSRCAGRATLSNRHGVMTRS